MKMKTKDVVITVVWLLMSSYAMAGIAHYNLLAGVLANFIIVAVVAYFCIKISVDKTFEKLKGVRVEQGD